MLYNFVLVSLIFFGIAIIAFSFRNGKSSSIFVAIGTVTMAIMAVVGGLSFYDIQRDKYILDMANLLMPSIDVKDGSMRFVENPRSVVFEIHNLGNFPISVQISGFTLSVVQFSEQGRANDHKFYVGMRSAPEGQGYERITNTDSGEKYIVGAHDSVLITQRIVGDAFNESGRMEKEDVYCFYAVVTGKTMVPETVRNMTSKLYDKIERSLDATTTFAINYTRTCERIKDLDSVRNFCIRNMISLRNNSLYFASSAGIAAEDIMRDFFPRSLYHDLEMSSALKDYLSPYQ